MLLLFVAFFKLIMVTRQCFSFAQKTEKRGTKKSMRMWICGYWQKQIVDCIISLCGDDSDVKATSYFYVNLIFVFAVVRTRRNSVVDYAFFTLQKKIEKYYMYLVIEIAVLVYYFLKHISPMSPRNWPCKFSINVFIEILI